MRIYITHCSAKKDDSLKGTGKKVRPQALYTAIPTQRFMNCCMQAGVNWAIFSDLYGVWFPDIEHEWYEKDPDYVTDCEFEDLLRDFETKLGAYHEVAFYYNPGRFHPLYKRLIQRTSLKIVEVTHLWEIRNV